jgi:hypothetical protein
VVVLEVGTDLVSAALFVFFVNQLACVMLVFVTLICATVIVFMHCAYVECMVSSSVCVMYVVKLACGICMQQARSNTLQLVVSAA